MEQMVAAVKEIPGVLGVCIYDSTHQLILDRMPSFFPANVWQEGGGIVADLYSRAKGKLPEVSSLTLHFNTVSLFLTLWEGNLTVILGEAQMNEHMVAYSLSMLKGQASSVGGAAPVPETKDKSSSPVLFFEKQIPELRERLLKVAGPMAEIIFDDALEKWQQDSDPSFDGFLACLRMELQEDTQFTEYLSLCAGTISEIKEIEKKNG